MRLCSWDFYKSIRDILPSLHGKKNKFRLPDKDSNKRNQSRPIDLEITQNVHNSTALNV